MENTVCVMSGCKTFCESVTQVLTECGLRGRVEQIGHRDAWRLTDAESVSAIIVDLATTPLAAILPRLSGDLAVPLVLVPAGASVRAMLKEQRWGATTPFGDTLRLEGQGLGVYLQDRFIPLSSREFQLVEFLLTHLNAVVDRDTILDQVFGETYDGRDRNVDVLVSRLRRRLFDLPACPVAVRAVSGVGYKLMAKSALVPAVG